MSERAWSTIGPTHSIVWSTSYAAWHLREPHWTWPEIPFESALYRSHEHPLGVCRLFPRRLVSADVDLAVMGIGGVYVAAEYRGKGIARRLLKAVCEALADRRLLAAVLHARDGRLYQQLGFVEIAEQLWAKPLLGLEFRARTPAQTWPDIFSPSTWRLKPAGHF